MSNPFICPLCGSMKCEYKAEVNGNYDMLQCTSFKEPSQIYISNEILQDYRDIKGKCLDLIYNKVFRSPYCVVNNQKFKWHFYYDENESLESYESKNKSQVNLAFEIHNYPASFIEIIDCALLNITYCNPYYNNAIAINNRNCRLLYIGEQSAYGYNTTLFFDLLIDFGYLRKENNNYYITAKGWQHIDCLKNTRKELRQGFIAMAFGEETMPIRESFRRAISESRFAVKIIDEKEHNNQIVPEIFFEIERSKFVVVDVTYPNYGAYYEAGYAQALGKQVIVCCREDSFNSVDKTIRPHFDISQKSMIVWKDEDELIKRLKRRIEATVQ